LVNEHQEAPHLRLLQKRLAKEITTMIHSEEDYLAAVEASQILFGKGTTEVFKKLSAEMIRSIFEGVPQSNIALTDIDAGIPVIDFLTNKAKATSSNREAREFLKNNAIAINGQKVKVDFVVDKNALLQDKYILVQRGKKNFYLVICG
jgi:tyrosyl-tRNA synthetase